MTNFEIKLKEYTSFIDDKLKTVLVNTGKNYDVLTDAMLYSLTVGGKRIRPILLLEFHKLCGGKDNVALPFALALEMIHTYSLIHDDLPCMDNDDFRRGKPSCHKAFSENIAVLAGDALLTDAFRVASTTDLPSDRVVKALNVLANLSGVNGMIGGQIIDICSEGNTVNEDTLRDMYHLKTGALIKAAATIGCILAGKDDFLPLAEKYAENIGLSFQITDDILDVKSTADVLGKPINSDIKNNKTTFVTLYGIKESTKKVVELTEDAKNIIDKISANGEFLKELADYLAQRNY